MTVILWSVLIWINRLIQDDTKIVVDEVKTNRKIVPRIRNKIGIFLPFAIKFIKGHR